MAKLDISYSITQNKLHGDPNGKERSWFVLSFTCGGGRTTSSIALELGLWMEEQWLREVLRHPKQWTQANFVGLAIVRKGNEMKSKGLKKGLGLFLLLLLTAVYVRFLLLDWGWAAPGRLPARALKYGGVILCFFVACLAGGDPGFGMISPLCWAMGITLIADFFLLFETREALGVGIFCGAQLFHMRRFRGRWPKKALGATAVCLAGCVVLHGFGKELLGLAVAGACYGALLVGNGVFAWRGDVAGAARVLAGIGMALFICCDVTVLLYQLPLAAPVHTALGGWMWLFYLPSQALIAFSGWPHYAAAREAAGKRALRRKLAGNGRRVTRRR